MEPPTAELDTLLERWSREVYGNSGASPVPILTSIAELIERETEVYLKLPIDPFDDRHPSRASPDCTLGLLLKSLFKNENFMSQLTTDYLTSSRSNFDLHVVSCRLLLDILPGLDSSVVFLETETLVKQLIEWAEKADFPLHSYATGLLGAAMEVAEISILYRDQNNVLVPLMLNRLSQITQTASSSIDQSSDNIDPRDLIDVSETTPSYRIHTKPLNRNNENNATNILSSNDPKSDTTLSNGSSSGQKHPGSIKRPRCAIEGFDDIDDVSTKIPPKFEKKTLTIPSRSPLHNDCSSSSWAEAFMSGSYQMHPISTVMQQRFILQYLSVLGEYQELLIHMFEHKALSYILYFIDARKNPDVRLAFDALKFLAAFLTHKKFALEFLDHGGLLQLLRVNRHAMASSGVSICLYYLAYNEDVLERICWMKREIVERMVAYGLWLLERSPDSSKAFAAMFFSLCFHFPILLKLFDEHKGLRKLLNVISMRPLFSDVNQDGVSDDELFSRRQTAKQVCIALKKYTRSHFLLETRKLTRMTNTSIDQECKPISVSDENTLDAVELHRQQNLPRSNWRAIDCMIAEDGISYLLRLVGRICTEGQSYAGKLETVRNALEILVVCSLSPNIQKVFLKETIPTRSPYPMNHPATAVILMCADPKTLDADCLKSSMNILINLASSNPTPRVPAPTLSTSMDSDRILNSARKKHNTKNMIDLSITLKKAIWANNGTLILPKLLTVTSPLTEADAIRSLVCRVLCELAREDSIRQMMSKLPLFADGHLQSLMKEPIIPEKRIEHSNFCTYCRELIQHVTGTEVASMSGLEPSLAEIRRRMIVAQTKIDYDRNEAYHLIHNYLNSEGFPEVAAAFYKAANLSAKPIKGCIGSSIARTQPRSPPLSISQYNLDSSLSQTPGNKQLATSQNTPAITNLRSNLRTPNSAYLHSSNSKSLQMQKSNMHPSNLYKKLDEATNSSPITLDSILTDYLRHQHSLCKNPVSTCPPFELLAPHRCPEPTNRLMAPRNITSRIMRRRVFAPWGGYNGAKYDRHYIYSKFRPVRQVRESVELRHSSTCCAFSSDGQYLFVGTEAGVLKAYNINTGIVEATYECHNMAALAFIQASSDDNLIITTCPDAPSNPTSVLWTFSDVFERKQRFDNDHHAEFGKLPTSDRIVSTQETYARLWDTATGMVLQKYEGYHRYTHNRATLNYNDSLVLNDGILWDVRTCSAIHRFAKFNERINGIFHPNGSEIICNSQVWDIRNFRLLQTVPAFDQCQLKFNSMGDVIFSTIVDDQADINSNYEFKTSFRTFDSHDYSTIATIDLKKTIFDLAISSGDEHVALVEAMTTPRQFYEEYLTDLNVCRLYEVGRPKYDADAELDDDDDEDGEQDDEENADEMDDEDELDIDDEEDVDDDDDEEDDDDDDDEDDDYPYGDDDDVASMNLDVGMLDTDSDYYP